MRYKKITSLQFLVNINSLQLKTVRVSCTLHTLQNDSITHTCCCLNKKIGNFILLHRETLSTTYMRPCSRRTDIHVNMMFFLRLLRESNWLFVIAYGHMERGPKHSCFFMNASEVHFARTIATIKIVQGIVTRFIANGISLPMGKTAICPVTKKAAKPCSATDKEFRTLHNKCMNQEKVCVHELSRFFSFSSERYNASVIIMNRNNAWQVFTNIRRSCRRREYGDI